MHPISKRYREENGVSLVEIKLNTIQQLFHSFDPSPFHEKDLDPEAEAYIFGAAREFPLKHPLKLVLYLPQDQVPAAEAANLPEAIRNYFRYQHEAANRDRRFQLQEGRLALAIGLAFLFLCVSIREIALVDATAMWKRIAAEGLVILGWVAMWHPINVFLYEWWPLWRRALILAKLAAIPVEIRATGPAPTPAPP